MKRLKNIFFRSEKNELPGMNTGDKNVYEKGEVRTQDSIYRDVYGKMRKVRGNKEEATSRLFISVGSGIVGGGSAIILFLLIPLFYSGMYDLFNDFEFLNLDAAPSYWATVKNFMFGSIFSVIPYGLSIFAGAVSYTVLEKYWKKENLNIVNTDIDFYESDSYIQLPEQMPFSYDVFPDAGAHSSVSPTAVLSHMMFSPKGLQKIEIAERYKGNTEVVLLETDEDGNDHETEHTFKKGEFVTDEYGETVYEKQSIIDTEFGHKLFNSAFIPEDDSIRHFYDTTKLLYNPKHVRDKNDVKTVAEHIKDDWEFPDYEVQRPAGAYIVDTEPNNTLVLAMTRAGKGQTIIEPTIDMWTREKVLNNFAINDPKGELYVKFYYPATKRGYDVVAFNLINPSSTNIYNPLGYAVDAARQGDNQKVEEFVSSIGDVFFPTENADDPMWPNAANAAFKRSALGLIDYYQEEDREYRIRANFDKIPQTIIDQYLDEMWGRVTLYNVYQMMTELASKKSNDPSKIHIDKDDPSEEKDYLTLFFDATAKLPRNALRSSTMNQDNSLRAMAGSDKTIASVYGISLTAMLFFTGEKISRLTSGRPSQNFDMVGLGFPRRIGVRFDKVYMDYHNFIGQRTVWTAYRDENYTDKYEGEDFMHESKVDSNGWSFYYFKGIFENRKTYLKLEVFDNVSNLRAKTFRFEFEKGFQRSLNGRTYVYDPVHKDLIVHDGVLRELVYSKVRKKDKQNNRMKDEKGNPVFTKELRKGASMITRSRVILSRDNADKPKEDQEKITEQIPVFKQNDIHYKEKPKAVFFITPPHLMEYAKIILILINQMFNLQVDKSYLTKSNQKPMYKTRYMLDEVGNLQSEGNGIPYLNTKASIGLGQEQQYTLILQTLQQLIDVYGESVDKIIQGNTGNIVYLKSTDDSMLATLESMSGTLHEAMKDSKAVTTDAAALVSSVDARVTYTTTMKESPTISKKDMLNIPKANAMVFGKGHPIWARNEMALPMSYQLHANQLVDPISGPYALANVPTTSNTDEFDILANKPDFFRMVEKRVTQAKRADEIRERYMRIHNLDTFGLSKKNPELLAEELMRGINEDIQGVAKEQKAAQSEQEPYDETQDSVGVVDPGGYLDDDDIYNTHDFMEGSVDNTELNVAREKSEETQRYYEGKIYAQKNLSRNDIYSNRKRNSGLDHVFSEVYAANFGQFDGQKFAGGVFSVNNDSSLVHNGEVVISYKKNIVDELKNVDNSGDVQKVPDYSDNGTISNAMLYMVQDRFYELLIQEENWDSLLNGRFDDAVARLL